MNILVEVLRDPTKLRDLNTEQWNLLLRLGRFNNLLGTISVLTEKQNITTLPDGLIQTLSAEKIRSIFFQLQAKREIKQLEAVFSKVNFKVVLLKGSAYIAQDLPSAEGRRLSDVDILIPKDKLSSAEKILIHSGWIFNNELNTYDEYYYRALTHELPPMKHQFRYIELDVHHNLCSPISRITIPEQKLFNDVQAIEKSTLFTLSNHDMFLHSAVHLFFNDELRGGIRDLYDMHLLFEDKIQNQDNLARLIERAAELNLARPLYYAISALDRVFKTSLPIEWEEMMEGSKPNLLIDALMKKLIDNTLAPSHSTSKLVNTILLTRAHWVKMPPKALLKHFSHKLLTIKSQ